VVTGRDTATDAVNAGTRNIFRRHLSRPPACFDVVFRRFEVARIVWD